MIIVWSKNILQISKSCLPSKKSSAPKLHAVLNSADYTNSTLCTLYTINVKFNFNKYIKYGALLEHFYTM